MSSVNNYMNGIYDNNISCRSSPQFANRFVTKHKKTQAFTDFFRVSFSSIQKGFIAKITSFFAF